MASKIMSKSRRGRAATKRLDVAQARQLLRDGLVWTGLGVVRLFPGELQHFEVVASEEPDVLVDVELVPGRERLVCRLGIAVGAVWQVPPVDSEVAVLIPQGDLEADPIIVGVISTPPGILTGSNVVIMARPGGTVEVYDGSGTPKALAYKEDVEALKDYVSQQFTSAAGHTHAVSGSSTTTVTPVAVSAPAASPGPPAPAGTSVLKAK